MSISRGNNQWCLYNVAWKGSKITVFLFCFVSSGAETPGYVAMLPINAGKPQGEFLKDKVILEWETMSFRSHAVATDKDSIQEGRWVTVFTRLNAAKIDPLTPFPLPPLPPSPLPPFPPFPPVIAADGSKIFNKMPLPLHCLRVLFCLVANDLPVHVVNVVLVVIVVVVVLGHRGPCGLQGCCGPSGHLGFVMSVFVVWSR